MADQITKIQIRKGTAAAKDTITLDSGELGYTTDYRRVFVGNNGVYNAGGDVVGNTFNGIYNFSTDINSLKYSLSGDFAFDVNTTTLKVLSGSDTDGGTKNPGQVSDNWGTVGNYNEGTINSISVGNGLVFNTADTTITTSGTLNLKLQDGSTTDNFSQPCILQKSANGLYASWDIIYPIDSVIFSYVNVNPTDAGGSLEGSGQIWSAAGTVTTAGTGTATIYAFKRDS